MRAFLAIEVDAMTRCRLEELQNSLRRAGVQDVTWVKPDAMHVTLQFLGEISQEQCRVLQMQLRDLPVMKSFTFIVQGTGAFPSPSRASVLWAGIKKNAQLDELVSRVRLCVQACAIHADFRPFCPHLTLGRIRRPRRHDAFAKILERQALFHAEIPVHSFVLMESQLTSKGPLYQVIERFVLA